MSDSLVAQFQKMIESLDIPANDVITDKAITLYETGQDVLKMYRGDPDVLMQALRVFISTQVRPLIYAGAAYVMLNAAYISGSEYDPEGVKYAQTLYDRAANLCWNSLHVALLEVSLFSQQKQLDQMRSALDS